MKRTSRGQRRPERRGPGFQGISVLLITVSGLAAAARAGEPVDFARDVGPILEQNCIRCHQPGTRKGDLSLATPADLAAGEYVVPGRPEESGLLELVVPPEPGQRPEMPRQGAPLSAEQVGILRRWISEGARWPAGVVLQARIQPSPTWWSLRPLADVVPPELELEPEFARAPADWAINPIDRFLMAKLVEKGLRPAPPADRRTLIRRVCFDLTGLPPTPEQVDSFVADTNPAAYEKLVDRLLASPGHGERWARHWLDVIHFADTHGHEADVLRPHAWRYRDYVIDSLNRDTPWPRFIREQLAADVFYPAEPWLTPALGFLGAGPCDLSAAGTAPKMFEYLDRDDLVTQTMAAFASTTVNCARCHDHKFDPITQGDYFALQAVFAGVAKGTVAFDRDLDAAAQRSRYRALLRAAETAQADVLLTQENTALVARWDRQEPPEWRCMNVEALASSEGAVLERHPDGSIGSGGPCPDKATYTLTLASTLPEITALRLEVLSDPALPHQGPGRGENGGLQLSEFEAALIRPGTPGPQSQKLVIRRATADWNPPDRGIARALDGDPLTAWAIDPRVGQSHHAVFELAEPIALEPGATLVLVLKQLQGNKQLIGRFRLSATNAPADAAIALPPAAAAARGVPSAERTPQQQLALAAAVLRAHAEGLIARLPAPEQVYAAAATVENHKGTLVTIATPPVVRILERGELDRPGAETPPGALSAVTGLKARFDQLDPRDEAARRAALADWLADPANPLTWRSIANRVWQYHFGTGLCDTPSDFGCMGGTPSHPELLDWLAARLRSSGGSLKDLHRLICTSAAYRQGSTHSTAAALVDPDNRLVWHMSRRRLDAEGFRDALLALSDRLDLSKGGPGVAQFQLHQGPNPLNHTPTVDYSVFDWDSPGATRRSIYRIVWRCAPDPFMNALDFPDAALAAPVRGVSASPLQALSLLNNDFVLHQCEHLAARIATPGTTPDDQVRAAFRLALLREPTSSERADFVALAAQHSLAAVCRVLLNSNEFLFVE
jgi:mono/diheme cytochrome c family protein